ncbi:YbjN domain-containing protein [Brevibacterium spongiae]|uniref:YbjN domain-containing protein n=1 Tax=Brevibacterium spongiae TaxID=2909672 RepID=A0ABY5SMK0_9MICO|nr:YbjN domain-containing protein [Brevibacterium spongiae]UVI35515.1 YbjN domain-containing protein [Brevibacterium spongiae]
MTTDTEAILAGVRTWAEDNDVPVDSVEDTEIVVTLPGEKKLKTNVAISVFARTAHLQAFVIRHPDENAAEFNRWLLQKNLKPGPVAFAIDSLGDVYLRASVPREHLLDELDALLGAMLSTADSSFNELLLIGFLTGMKKEWAWRVARGESTRNLAAFESVLSGDDNEFLGTFGDGETDHPEVVRPETAVEAGSPQAAARARLNRGGA